MVTPPVTSCDGAVVSAATVYTASSDPPNPDGKVNCYWLDRSKYTCADYGHLADEGQNTGFVRMCKNHPTNQQRCQADDASKFQCAPGAPSPSPSPPPAPSPSPSPPPPSPPSPPPGPPGMGLAVILDMKLTGTLDAFLANKPFLPTQLAAMLHTEVFERHETFVRGALCWLSGG